MDYLLVLLKEHRHAIVAVATLVVSLLLLLAVRPGNRGPGMVEDAALNAVGNLQGLIQLPVDAMQSLTFRMAQWHMLEEENHRFRQELKLLRPLDTRVMELEMENQRLRQLLSMPLDPVFHSIAARVVGDTSTAFANALLLDTGRLHGARVNASVLVPEGVVGRIVQTSSRTSLVLTLLDLNSRVPVLVQRTRTNGIVAGFNGQNLRLEYISKDADIRPGDQILTSGIAGSFPKGLPVGIVKEVRDGDTGLFQRILVQPAVDFDRIEEVRLIIPGKQPPAPPPAMAPAEAASKSP
ncbi:MAG: rod shape-determining protein MreC [Magnetococcales bacterium]|nr:rod shape-determining protein MreC [Magnetococcales bacterium]